MPHSEKWARRLVRELAKREPGELVLRKSYRDRTFLPLLFEHLNELNFTDPRAALPWAKLTPELVRKTFKADLEWMSLALGILGSSYLLCSEHAKSEETLTEALDCTLGHGISRADILRRLAYLKGCQKKYQEATSLAEEALGILREHGDSESIANGLSCLGYTLALECKYSASVLAYGEALALIDPKQSKVSERIHLGASTNLIYVMASARPKNQKAALGLVRRARELVKGSKRSVARYRLLWIEGTIWESVGLHRRAETAFTLARDGFVTQKMPFEIALISLSLGTILQLSGEWEQLEKLASETYLRLRILTANTEAVAALSLWRNAIRGKSLTESAVEATRGVIISRLGPATQS